MGEATKYSEDSSDIVTEDTAIEIPPECNVILYNDDFTPMDFVVDVLVSIFNKSYETAESIMLSVHEKGSGVAGTYTFDVAVSRANLAQSAARKNGFPLRVEVEQ